ncbi:phosphogluconate dehydrogenase (NAD(+)-dependent, decarboxylating) [Terrilactibacillus laevilacticus]|uniref:phosphogluconate dehydrogenase (NAD(+)-dependent, decarboxylating) n=1 Tax=Terrilactibacillus laevilacticus TaxID=1380157 RepID=UPI001146A9E1|nr:decarboxylating 6-phosphogluconate dehydrogenase [Terrilactibacillus laevilacticus]
MNIGFIGLGKMGANMVENMLEHGHEVVVYDKYVSPSLELKAKGAVQASGLHDLINKLPKPRKIWVMVPVGEPIKEVLSELLEILEPHDIVIDGGNSNYKLSMDWSARFKEAGIHFLDVGTSGGMSGARHGACFMIGGNENAFKSVEKVIQDIAIQDGYLYTGPSGSGHFLKMVHNGIEYGMMQAIAEGFEVVEKSSFNYDLEAVSHVWNHGSVIRCWLMELIENAFKKDPDLDGIKGIMASSGEGKWTVETALDLQVPTPVIALSLMMRYRSLETDTFTGKVVAALRNEFGGHAVEHDD